MNPVARVAAAAQVRRKEQLRGGLVQLGNESFRSAAESLKRIQGWKSGIVGGSGDVGVIGGIHADAIAYGLAEATRAIQEGGIVQRGTAGVELRQKRIPRVAVIRVRLRVGLLIGPRGGREVRRACRPSHIDVVRAIQGDRIDAVLVNASGTVRGEPVTAQECRERQRCKPALAGIEGQDKAVLVIVVQATGAHGLIGAGRGGEAGDVGGAAKIGLTGAIHGDGSEIGSASRAGAGSAEQSGIHQRGSIGAELAEGRVRGRLPALHGIRGQVSAHGGWPRKVRLDVGAV